MPTIVLWLSTVNVTDEPEASAISLAENLRSGVSSTGFEVAFVHERVFVFVFQVNVTL